MDITRIEEAKRLEVGGHRPHFHSVPHTHNHPPARSLVGEKCPQHRVMGRLSEIMEAVMCRHKMLFKIIMSRESRGAA